VKRPPSAKMTRSRRLFWGLILGVILVGGILALGVFLFAPDVALANLTLPVALQSRLAADYSPDNRALVIQPVSMNLVSEALRDRQPTVGPNGVALTPVNFYPTLVEILKTPVFTVTPNGLATLVIATREASPTAPVQATSAPSATATQQASATSAAVTPDITGTPTLTPTGPLPSKTPVPLPSSTIEVNQPAPTDKPAPTNEPATKAPPTAPPPTPVPPTPKPVPPTPKPEPPTPVPPPQPTAYQPPPPPPKPTSYP
jgi:hypothetical protein